MKFLYSTQSEKTGCAKRVFPLQTVDSREFMSFNGVRQLHYIILYYIMLSLSKIKILNS